MIGALAMSLVCPAGLRAGAPSLAVVRQSIVSLSVILAVLLGVWLVVKLSAQRRVGSRTAMHGAATALSPIKINGTALEWERKHFNRIDCRTTPPGT